MSHPKLQVPTLPEDEADKPWYNTIELGYAWIFGYRPYNYWSNTTTCFDHMTNLTYHEMPAYREYMDDDSHSTSARTSRTLFLVRYITQHVWHCSAAFQSMNRFWYDRWFIYDGLGHFFLSFLQNILGQVISLTNLYRALEVNIYEGNTYLIHYDTARLVRILTIFDPIELRDDDLIYN